MEWQLVVALVIMIPVILLPVAFIWYLNLGGMRLLLRVVRRGRSSRDKRLAPEEVK